MKVKFEEGKKLMNGGENNVMTDSTEKTGVLNIIARHLRDQKVTGVGQCRFTKSKSCACPPVCFS